MASQDIRTITTTEELADFCALAKQQPYVTLDTEFLRERNLPVPRWLDPAQADMSARIPDVTEG